MHNLTWSEFQSSETAAVARLNPTGRASDNGTDASAVDFLSFGTEGGRIDHALHWPLWSAVKYDATSAGAINSTILYS